VAQAQVVKIGVVKAGCVGTLPLLEFLLDERAERTDIDVRVMGSGAKLGPEQCKAITSWMIQHKPDFTILIGPAQPTVGPTEARKMLVEAGIPTIVISDGPTKKMVKDLEAAGLGYIIVEADSMIGARREFLDPAEMALYNADILKVLAATGALNVIVRELEQIIQSLKKGQKPQLPRVIIDKDKAVEAAGFKNPYAKAKAAAAYEIARHVAEVNVEACFKVPEWQKYIALTATGHEMMRTAGRLADEAREIEKAGDSLLRKPHFDDGTLGEKRALIEKPKRPE